MGGQGLLGDRVAGTLLDKLEQQEATARAENVQAAIKDLDKRRESVQEVKDIKSTGFLEKILGVLEHPPAPTAVFA